MEQRKDFRIEVDFAGRYCCRRDRDLTIEVGVEEIAGLLGFSAEEIRVSFQNRLLDLVRMAGKWDLLQEIAEQLSKSEDIEVVMPLYRKDGTVTWVMNRGRRHVSEKGEEYLCGVLVEMNRHKLLYDIQKQRLEQYRTIMSVGESILFEWDFKNDIMHFSGNWEKVFGYKPQTEHMTNVIFKSQHIHPEDQKRLIEHVHAISAGTAYRFADIRILKADGDYLWCKVKATGVYGNNGELVRVIGVIIDIDEEKKATFELRVRAEQDSLTKLLNAHVTRDRAEVYLAGQQTREVNGALLIVDLDDFKQVNDTYGHLFGDEVLIQTARRIKKLFRPHDVVGRIGGEEFLVLMKDIPNREIVLERASQLVEGIREVFRERLEPKHLSCSVGVAFAGKNRRTYEELFICADKALYLAKNQGKDRFIVYND